MMAPIAFVPSELAMRSLILDLLPGLDPGQVGGDFAYAGDTYVRVDKVGSVSDALEGDFVVDVEVFGSTYLGTYRFALDLDARILERPYHVVDVDGRKIVLEDFSQNAGPDDLPWDDDYVHRIGSTYAFTMRRV